jgi:Lipopolysaccharide-assembly, LptC-related
MKFLLVPAGCVLLAGPAWAQEATTAADKADQAMAAMEELEKSSAPAKPTKPTKRDKAAIEKAAGDEAAEPAPAVLPGPVTSPPGMGSMSRVQIDMMLPIGRSHRGVHYPTYRPLPAGRVESVPVPGEESQAGIAAPLDSLFESDIMTRLDEDHVQFDHAKWVQYGETPEAGGKPQPSMILEIERGIYDLKNNILMTNQPVKIENPKFVIEGDAMLHDRASGLTRLTGRVKMSFYSDPEPEATEPAPPAAPAAAKTPTKP